MRKQSQYQAPYLPSEEVVSGQQHEDSSSCCHQPLTFRVVLERALERTYLEPNNKNWEFVIIPLTNLPPSLEAE